MAHNSVGLGTPLPEINKGWIGNIEQQVLKELKERKKYNGIGTDLMMESGVRDINRLTDLLEWCMATSPNEKNGFNYFNSIWQSLAGPDGTIDKTTGELVDRLTQNDKVKVIENYEQRKATGR